MWMDEAAAALGAACGEGWSPCTVGQLQARTPNRVLTELGSEAFLLAQSGCFGTVGRPYQNPGVVPTSTSCSASCTAGDVGHGGLIVTAASPFDPGPYCGSNIVACGGRTCRTPGESEPVDGVLCCLNDGDSSCRNSVIWE